MDQKVQVKLIIRRVPTQAALSWLTKAWELFRQAPSTLIAMMAFTTVLSLLAQLHPVLGVILVLANPFLTAGLYKTIVLLQQQQLKCREKNYRMLHQRSARSQFFAVHPLVAQLSFHFYL